jgi:uncharacterized ion transporter superfamily protein YfcC
MGLKIGNFAVFKGFLGSSVLAFGTWTITEVTALIAILTLVLVFIYKIKWDEVYEGAVAGITRMLPVVALIVLSNIVFILVTQSGILYTILNFFASMTKGINAFTYSIASFLGGALVGNEDYVSGYVTQLFGIVLGEKANLTLLILIQQIMYGFAMIFVPTSALLLAGLAYLEVSYTKWIKKIWPLLLGLLVVSLIIIVLAVAL